MKWTQLDINAIRPTRATEYSAGYDLRAIETTRIEAGECKLIRTGISFEDLGKDEYIQLSLRSSVSLKRPLIMPNSPAIIDSDYAGHEIGIILWNRSWRTPCLVDEGERIAQAIILKYHTTEDENPVTTKRTGGRGSTGNK